MNLLLDDWIRYEEDGQERFGRPADIADQLIRDIRSPRPDFRGALFQLLIGLLQTAFAPADWDEWVEFWETTPSIGQLDEAFNRFATAFEFDLDGPAFMQDFDSLAHGDLVDIAKLLIETPGDNTVGNNNDHFVHRRMSTGLCAPCATSALFTLQINAPSGGAGNRVSLRGGGPMTTLRLPNGASPTLWRKLWSNILPAERKSRSSLADILPWMAPTRTSQTQGGTDTTPESVDALQAFWSMPRRIRLDWAGVSAGVCSVCGVAAERIVRQYRTRPHGVNYTGAWMHPLTPYSLDPKQENLPIPIKGQPSGIGYRQWLGWSFGDDLRKPSRVVTAFSRRSRRLPDKANEVTLWCFGYDMDNMKARCWYDATLPLPSIDPEDITVLREAVQRVLNVAIDTAGSLRKAVGAATNPSGECDDAVPQNFWARSEPLFYDFLWAVAAAPQDDNRVAELSRIFLTAHYRLALELFDEWVLAVPLQDTDLGKIVKERVGLEKTQWKKNSRELRTWIDAMTEVIA